jgi:hypothetical protein
VPVHTAWDIGQNVALREKALKYSEEMLKILVWLARNSDNPTVKLAAADKVLDRAHGRPPQPHDGDGQGGSMTTLMAVTGVPEPD